MRKTLYILILLSIGFANAQTDETKLTAEETKIFEETIYADFDLLTTKPDYPGGVNAFYQYVMKNFKIPEAEVNGKIVSTFIIEKDGTITNIEVKQHLGHGTDAEIIRILESMSKWQPGKIDGKPVRTRYTIPITIHSAE